MTVAAMLLAACAVQAPAEAPGASVVVGTVQLVRAVGGPRVRLVTDDGTLKLQGELADEVARLQSAKVEAIGSRDGQSLRLKAYRIIEVAGGKPLVGELRAAGSGNLALNDGEGTDIPLSLSPRAKQRLAQRVGAKLWVHGKKLLSGELKVLRYGILRDPPKKPDETKP